MKHLLLIGVLGISPFMALGCECEELSANDVVAEAQAIFIGHVERILIPDQPELERQINEGLGTGSNAHLVITERWKGVEGDESVNVYQNNGNCNVLFELGKEYILFCRIEDGELVTHTCMGSKENVDTAELIDLLGPGQLNSEGEEEEGTSNIFLLVLGAFLVAIVLGRITRKKKTKQVPDTEEE